MDLLTLTASSPALFPAELAIILTRWTLAHCRRYQESRHETSWGPCDSVAAILLFLACEFEFLLGQAGPCCCAFVLAIGASLVLFCLLASLYTSVMRFEVFFP